MEYYGTNRVVLPTNISLEDRNRNRRVVFYGRVSTEHEAQLAAAADCRNREIFLKFLDLSCNSGGGGYTISEKIESKNGTALVLVMMFLKQNTKLIKQAEFV